MRAIFVIIWIVVLLMGPGLFMFFPKAFEPLLCRADEFIEHQTHEISDASGTSWSTDLYCVNQNSVSRAVGEKVGIPFVVIMFGLMFVFFRFNHSSDGEQIEDAMNPKEETI